MPHSNRWPYSSNFQALHWPNIPRNIVLSTYSTSSLTNRSSPSPKSPVLSKPTRMYSESPASSFIWLNSICRTTKKNFIYTQNYFNLRHLLSKFNWASIVTLSAGREISLAACSAVTCRKFAPLYSRIWSPFLMPALSANELFCTSCT